jgi:hypothetical protein
LAITLFPFVNNLTITDSLIMETSEQPITKHVNAQNMMGPTLPMRLQLSELFAVWDAMIKAEIFQCRSKSYLIFLLILLG